MSETTDELDMIIDQMTLDINATGHIVKSITLSRKMDTESGRYWQVTVFFVTKVEHIYANSETLEAAVANAVVIAKKRQAPRVQYLRDLKVALKNAKDARLPEPLALPVSRLERALIEELGEW